MDSINKTKENSHIFRGETHENRSFSGVKNGKITSDRAIISINCYRELSGDKVSSDDVIIKRIIFIERLCRKSINEELQKYAKKKNART